MTIRELWVKIFGVSPFVLQLREQLAAAEAEKRFIMETNLARLRKHADELSVLREQISEERDRGERQMAANDEEWKIGIAEIKESRDYFRQRAERYELLLHPGLAPRSPKDPRPAVSVATGARRKSWPQILAENAAEELTPDNLKAEDKRRADQQKELAAKNEAAIKEAKARTAAKLAPSAEAPQQEIAVEEPTDVQSQGREGVRQ